MEAQAEGTPVTYVNETELYTGAFNSKVVDKFINEGIIELVSNEQGLSTILLNGRDDFLSGFASGVNEASLGRDQYYADYNANPFAFSVGFEHYQHISKKKGVPPDYICHGFELNEETHR